MLTGSKLTESFSLTLLTRLAPSLDVPSVLVDIRKESNSAWDFLGFVKFCIQKRHLLQGDTLVLDNASIHGSEDTIYLLDTLLTAAGINMRFLPTYSPELNPAELVFNLLKNKFRMSDREDDEDDTISNLLYFFGPNFSLTNVQILLSYNTVHCKL